MSVFRRYKRLGSREEDYAGDTQLGAWKVEAIAQGERRGKRTWARPEELQPSAWDTGEQGGLRTQRGEAQQGMVLQEEKIGRQNDESK